MKTLKFMLAAATAIGLASATQADQYNTTGFEKLAVGTNVTTGVQDNRSGYSYFYYAGSVAADNESVIAEGTPNIARPRGASAVDAERDKILQVSTGTDPLMRTYAPIAGGAPQSPTALEGTDVYVDTLVQFTVTPYTDTVTPGSADKLMIYLKESVVTNEFGEITSADTNLVVVGGFYSAGATTAREYVLNTGAVTVNPNEWHRLTVKAVCDISDSLALGFPGFAIWVDGVACTLDYYTFDENDPTSIGPTVIAANADVLAKKLVLSLLTGSGSLPATLQGVGFAGEGKVDDIVFATVDPFATVFDFTFTIGTGAAVTYTVGGTEYTQSRTFPEVEEGTAVQITSVSYDDDYMAGSTTAVNLSDPVEGVYTVTNAGASLTITAAEAYASVSGSKFGSFAEAISAAAGGDTVTLLRDAVGPVSTAASTLDLNGKKLAATKIEFTGADDKTLTGGDVTNLAAITVVSPSGQNLTIDDMTFHFDITPVGTGSVLTVSNCTFENDLANDGTTGEATSSADKAYHSFGLKLLENTAFDQADVVGNTFKQARRCGLAINKFVGDTYVYNNTFDGTKDCRNWDEISGNKYFPAMQIYAQGRVFIENNSFAGATIAEPFALYNEKTNVSSDKALVFNGNTVAATVPYLWSFYESPETPLPSVTNEANVVFGLNTIADGVDKTQGIYKNLVQPVPVAYGETLALPSGVATVYAWTHAEGATDFYVDGVSTDGLDKLAGGETVIAVPGADISGASVTLTPDATYKNKWTATAPTPSGESLEPGEQSSTTYDSQAAAEAAAASVTIAASDAVTNALDSAAQEAYLAKFEKKVVAAGEGQYKVEVALTAAATTALQAEVDADAAEVIEDLSESDVTLTTTPGFYYSFEYGTTLDNMAEVGTRTLATGSTLTLTRPTTGGATSGFYKVLVNVAPAPVTP